MEEAGDVWEAGRGWTGNACERNFPSMLGQRGRGRGDVDPRREGRVEQAAIRATENSLWQVDKNPQSFVCGVDVRVQMFARAHASLWVTAQIHSEDSQRDGSILRRGCPKACEAPWERTIIYISRQSRLRKLVGMGSIWAQVNAYQCTVPRGSGRSILPLRESSMFSPRTFFVSYTRSYLGLWCTIYIVDCSSGIIYNWSIGIRQLDCHLNEKRQGGSAAQ